MQCIHVCIIFIVVFLISLTSAAPYADKNPPPDDASAADKAAYWTSVQISEEAKKDAELVKANAAVKHSDAAIRLIALRREQIKHLNDLIEAKEASDNALDKIKSLENELLVIQEKLSQSRDAFSGSQLHVSDVERLLNEFIIKNSKEVNDLEATLADCSATKRVWDSTSASCKAPDSVAQSDDDSPGDGFQDEFLEMQTDLQLIKKKLEILTTLLLGNYSINAKTSGSPNDSENSPNPETADKPSTPPPTSHEVSSLRVAELLKTLRILEERLLLKTGDDLDTSTKPQENENAKTADTSDASQHENEPNKSEDDIVSLKELKNAAEELQKEIDEMNKA